MKNIKLIANNQNVYDIDLKNLSVVQSNSYLHFA